MWHSKWSIWRSFRRRWSRKPGRKDGGDAEHSWGTKCAEHRLYPAAILALDEALTAAESNENVRAVVLTAEGKYFCNGFDLRFLQQETQSV